MDDHPEIETTRTCERLPYRWATTTTPEGAAEDWTRTNDMYSRHTFVPAPSGGVEPLFSDRQSGERPALFEGQWFTASRLGSARLGSARLG